MVLEASILVYVDASGRVPQGRWNSARDYCKDMDIVKAMEH